jgi:hypothetical protein
MRGIVSRLALVLFVAGACVAPAAAAAADDRVTERVSTGPLGGNAAVDTCNAGPPSYICNIGDGVLLSEDGTRAVFTTSEQLTSDDTDSLVDIYDRAAGVTRLLSPGPGTPRLAGMSADGSIVFSTTTGQLVPEDTDALTDVYARIGGTTTLVSTGPLDNGSVAAGFAGSTRDGARVFFTTSSQLTSDDTDTTLDLYERSGGTTRLVSRLASCSSTCFAARALGSSEDGSHVAFSTHDSNTNNEDLYVSDLSGGQWTPQLASRTPADLNTATPQFAYLTRDGSRLYFTSAQALAPGASGSTELYVHTSAGIALVSTGSLNECSFDCRVTSFGISGDETHVYFASGKRLEPSDTDPPGTYARDLYERVGSTTTLLTPGPPACDVAGNCVIHFDAASGDGSRVVFTTDERLAAGDSGADYDIYERVGGTTTLLTPTGPTGGDNPTYPAFVAASADATRVVFTTGDALTPDDADPVNGCLYDDGDGEVFDVNCVDVYAREGGVFTLLSKGPSGGSAPREVYVGGGPGGPGILAASKDAQRVAFFTREALTPDDTDGAYDDIYLAGPAVTSPGYARPEDATPMFLSLVPAYQQCAAPNRGHGAPLSFGSCNPPVQTSPDLTVGTGDANGQDAAMIGFVAVAALPGDPTNPADEADLRFQLSLKDVRNASDLRDHTGAVTVRAVSRRTDKDGGIPSTTADFPFSFTAPCTATDGPSAGSTCAAITTVEALAPGAIVESARTIWALDKVQVYAGSSLFATQGIFVP